MFYEIENFKLKGDRTNIQFIEVLDGTSVPPKNYRPCAEDRVRNSNADRLYVQGPFRYYGTL